MKLVPGVMIGPYKLLTELSTRDAGTSRWGFATRDGVQYFIKQHTSPRYPMPGTGSETVIQRRMAVCRAFEQRKHRLKRELDAVASDGTIVNVHDVFRFDASYYTVTPKVDIAGLSPAEIASLTFRDRRIMMATAANALSALHTRHLVHADVKFTNVLVRRTELSYAARLIDFDSAFFEDDVPEPDYYGGTPEYFSPEALLYLQGKSTVIPHTAVDVFALGLVFCEWITMTKPATTTGTRSVAEGLIRGGSVITPNTGSADLDGLLAAMLDADPAERPTMFEVKNTLSAMKDVEAPRSFVRASDVPPPPKTPPGREPKLRLPLRTRRRKAEETATGSSALAAEGKPPMPSPEPSVKLPIKSRAKRTTPSEPSTDGDAR